MVHTRGHTVGLVSIEGFDREQQVLVLQVLDVGQDGLQCGQLLRGPAHTQEVYIIAALRVVLVTLLELCETQKREKKSQKIKIN